MLAPVARRRSLPQERGTSAANSHPSVSRGVLPQAVTALLINSFYLICTILAWSAPCHSSAPWFQRPARNAPPASGRAAWRYAPPPLYAVADGSVLIGSLQACFSRFGQVTEAAHPEAWIRPPS